MNKKTNSFHQAWLEIKERLFSSKTRILKTIGMCIIPFIYAFICIAAFWNPQANIGKTPMAIISLDAPTLKVASSDGIRAPQEITDDGVTSYAPFTENEWEQFDDDAVIKSNVDIANGTSITKLQVTSIEFVSYMDDFMNNWKSGLIQQLGYDTKTEHYTATVDAKMNLKTIDYINGTDTAKYCDYDNVTNKWNIYESKYYLELGVPSFFTQTIIDCEQDPTAAATYIAPLDGAINCFSSYQKSYFVGMTIESVLPFIVSMMMNDIVTDIVSDLLPDFANLLNPGTYIHVDIPNEAFAKYGIGIGELFICVGMWVGCISMITVLDRKQRVKKTGPQTWYFSKTLVMCGLAITQVLMLFLTIGILGWFSLGVTFLYELLFMLFVGVVFAIIVQSIWYCARDKALALFAAVVFMVLNLASGWGTFPSFMQFGFFQVISYIMPFTYAIHAQGAIIFGIGGGVNILTNTLYILQMTGVLCLFAAFFIALGLIMSKRRQREILYGTANSKKCYKAIKALKLSDKYCNNKTKKVVWTELPNDEMVNLKKETMVMFPYEKKFKWFEKPEDIHDFGTFE